MKNHKPILLLIPVLAFLAVLTLTTYQAFSQQSKGIKRKSDLSMIQKTVDSLNNRSRDLIRIDMEQSASLAKTALELSLTNSYEKGTAYAYRNQAILSYFGNNLSLALEYIQNAIEIFEKIQEKDGLADSNITLGLIFYRLGEKEQSLKAHSAAYEHYEHSERKDRYAIAAFNLAEAYYLNKDFDNAVNYAKNSLKVADENSNSSLVTSCLTLIGNVFYTQDKKDSALVYYDQTIEIGMGKNAPANKEALAESYWKKGKILWKSGQSSASLSYFEEALSLAKSINYRPLVADIYLSIIRSYLDMGNLMAAKNHLQEFSDDRSYFLERENEKDAQMVADLLKFQRIEKEAKKIREESEAKTRRLKNLTLVIVLTAVILTLLIGLTILLFRLLKKQKEVNLLKDRFVGMASHEFKTPLAVIASSVELLLIYKQKIEDAALQDKISGHLDKIYRQEKRLLTLVEDILIFEKLSQKKYSLQPEEIDLVVFIGQLLDDLPENEMKLRPIVVNHPQGNSRHLLIDRNLLYHLLINIVGNAYKYSPNAPAPEMDIHFFEDKVSIRVKDFGIGISEADQKFLFSSFFRGKNVGNIKGTGIGLSLVKAIVESIGGEISVESALNMGTSFTIQLPYQGRL